MRPRRHCASCGGSLSPLVDGSQACVECGETLYHNAAPTAAVVVLDADDRVLLARRAIEPRAGLWDLPGGFCGPTETPEACAVRELLEETGCAIALVAFLGFLVDEYGDGGDPTLNCVFAGRIEAGEPAPADDVAELRWHPLDEIPPQRELAFRNTGEAIELARTWRGRTPRP